MEGRSTIASEILASYAADAAREVDGVGGLVESALHRHKGVRVLEYDGRVRVELHVTIEWGVSIPDVGREVQQRVAAYLAQMASIELEAVDVIVDEIGVS
ncbi:MAG: Asp23/Gls24 family envelope stress response protein [Gaiellaceae bacterium]